MSDLDDEGEDPATFRPIRRVDDPVREIGRERARAGYRVFRAADGFEVAVPEQIVARMLALGRRAKPLEWYGLLVGSVCRDTHGTHVVVLGVVPDPDARAERSYVTSTVASEFQLRTNARVLYPEAVPIGWTHGHVGHGARYSGQDRRNQATWPQSYAVGIVVDPWSSPEMAVYRGPTSELLSEVRGEARAHGDAEASTTELHPLTRSVTSTATLSDAVGGPRVAASTEHADTPAVRSGCGKPRMLCLATFALAGVVICHAVSLEARLRAVEVCAAPVPVRAPLAPRAAVSPPVVVGDFSVTDARASLREADVAVPADAGVAGSSQDSRAVVDAGVSASTSNDRSQGPFPHDS